MRDSDELALYIAPARLWRALIISRQGIIDNSTKYVPRFVPWEKVAEIGIRRPAP